MTQNNVARRCWDEDAEIANDLSEAERRWILQQLDPEWCLHMRLDEAWRHHETYNWPAMAKLIEEVDEDNQASADEGGNWLVEPPCETLADVVRPWTEGWK